MIAQEENHGSCLSPSAQCLEGQKKNKEERGGHIRTGGWGHPRVEKETRRYFNKEALLHLKSLSNATVYLQTRLSWENSRLSGDYGGNAR